MDEVRIWDRALSATEVLANYDKCLSGNESNLFLYYRCNEYGNSTVTDATQNNNTGTFVNAPNWSFETPIVTGAACQNPITNVLSAVSSNSNICAGNTVTLTAIGATSYTWSTGVINANAIVSPSVTTTYTVTGTVLTCAGNVVMSALITVTVKPGAPLVSNAGPNQSVYFGYSPKACASLKGIAIGGVPAYTYLWNTGETTSTIKVCPTTSNNYTLAVKDANGCVSQSVVKVCVTDVRCSKGGNAIIKGSGNKVMICHITCPKSNHRTTLCVDASAVSAHLAHGDALGDCETGNCYTVPKSRQSIPDDLAIAEEIELKSFPNPFTDNTTIHFSLPTDGKVSIKVYNIIGMEVAVLFDGTILKDEANEVIFSSENLANGIYYCKLLNEMGEIKIQKIILAK
jgi:hypothetical protein